MEKKNNISKSNTSYRPEGSHTITPYLILKEAAKFLEFAKEGLEASIIFSTGADATAELRIRDAPRDDELATTRSVIARSFRPRRHRMPGCA